MTSLVFELEPLTLGPEPALCHNVIASPGRGRAALPTRLRLARVLEDAEYRARPGS